MIQHLSKCHIVGNHMLRLIYKGTVLLYDVFSLERPDKTLFDSVCYKFRCSCLMIQILNRSM